VAFEELILVPTLAEHSPKLTRHHNLWNFPKYGTHLLFLSFIFACRRQNKTMVLQHHQVPKTSQHVLPSTSDFCFSLQLQMPSLCYDLTDRTVNTR